MNLQRAQRARASAEMQELYCRFTRKQRFPGDIEKRTVWINADAERRYLELEASLKQEKEGINVEHG